MTSITLPDGKTLTYEYNTNSDLIKFTPPNLYSQSFGYDAAHLLTSKKNPLGYPIANIYDAQRRVVKQIDPRGGVTTLDFSVAGQTTITQPDTTVTRQVFKSGLLDSTTIGVGRPEASTWRYRYDPYTAGRTQEMGPDGAITRNTFDSAGNLTSNSDPMGRTFRYTYDNLGNRTSTTYPSGRRDVAEFDGRGNLLALTQDADGLALTTASEFDFSGSLIRSISPTGAISGYGYDSAGLLTELTDPDGRQVRLTYNLMGRETSRTAEADPANPGAPGSRISTKSWNYDRLISEKDPLGATTEYTYSPSGNLRYSIGPNSILYTYDDSGNPIEIASPNFLNVRKTTYDAMNRPLTQTTPNGAITKFGYDALGRVMRETDPLGGVTRRTFDAAGRVKTVTTPSGTSATNAYDASGLLLSRDYSDATPDVTYTYDADGQSATMRDGTGLTAYQLDAIGRVTQITNGAAKTVRYRYDGDDQVIGLTYPNGREVTRNHSPGGQLSQVKDWLGETTLFTRDNLGDLSRVQYGNGIVAEWKFNILGTPTNARYRKGAAQVVDFSALRSTSLSLPTEFPVNSLKSSAPVLQERSLTYSDRAQLSSVDNKPVTYDSAANLRLAADGSTAQYNLASQLTSRTIPGAAPTDPATTLNYTYSLDGTRKLVRNAATIVFQYNYDAERRLIAVRKGTATAPALVAAYDGDGLRMKTTTASGVKHFAYDQAGDLPMILSDGGTSYIYDDNGVPISQITGTTATTLLVDTQGNVRVLANQNGAVVGTASYSVTGVPETRTGVRSALGFNAQYTDAETGLQYLRARYYDPITSAFLTSDPLVNATGSAYGYAGGNPVSFGDPTGLFFVSCAEILTGLDGGNKALDGAVGVSEGLSRRASLLGSVLRTSPNPAVRSYAARNLKSAGLLAKKPALTGLRIVGKGLPVIGAGITYGTHVLDGDSQAESIGAAAGAALGGAAGVFAGTAACGTAAVATLGLGLLACPLLVVGGGVIGGVAGEGLGSRVGGWIGRRWF